MSAPFIYYFSNECPFWEKRGALIRGRRSLNISRQKRGANSREVLFRTKALFRVNTVWITVHYTSMHNAAITFISYNTPLAQAEYCRMLFTTCDLYNGIMWLTPVYILAKRTVHNNGNSFSNDFLNLTP